MNRFLLALILVFLFGLNFATAQNFSTHQVKKNETIDDIAKRYYVTPSDIYALNPDAKKGLKPNTVLIIPISKANKPKLTINRELQGFKEHKTKRKETLYSLTKEYGVSEDEIKKYNTFLYSNTLRKGDKLQIPIFKETEVVEENLATKTYTVLPKEGKWRIAYKFGITLEELQALNPEMDEILKEGQEINVPNLDKGEVKIVDEKYSYYKVLPKEGFYRLKLKLGLEQTELEALNPDLKETGLKNGMILKIPFSDLVNGTLESARINLMDSITDFSTKRIAIMLPFRLNRVDFDSVSDTKRSIKKDPYLNASLDFYSGVLVAIDSLKKLGISLKVDVYDTKREVGEVTKIIDENDFENVHAVIGPLTSNTFDKVASELRKYNVPVVSPIGSNLQLYDNVFQSKPSDELLKIKLINFIKRDSLPKNIVIISDTKNSDIANSIKQEFNYSKSVYSRKNKDGKDENYVLVDDIRVGLKPGKNIVFLETQNTGFASNVTSILASLIQKENIKEKKEAIDIVLVTTNYNSAFEGDEVSNEHLSKLHFHFSASTRAYNETDKNTFVKRYKSIYNITPDASAVKGFDLTMDVVLRLVSSNDLYMSVNKAPLTEYIENKFAYKKKLFGGYYNDAVYLVKYEDLTIVEVK